MQNILRFFPQRLSICFLFFFNPKPVKIKLSSVVTCRTVTDSCAFGKHEIATVLVKKQKNKTQLSEMRVISNSNGSYSSALDDEAHALTCTCGWSGLTNESIERAQCQQTQRVRDVTV